MKKLFVFLLAMVIMCLFTCNTAATEAVVEMTRYDTASLKDFSDIVNDKTIEEHGLLERRKEDEEKSLNTLAYLKKDGQNVAFVYPYDVKYTDKNGNIKDKSREIVKDGLFTNTSYKTRDNDIISYFSINSDGNVEVKTTYGDGCIISVMENRNHDNKITASKDENGNLIYYNAVDTGIHLMYEAQYNGVKEYIVIDEKMNGGNVYAFQMTFEGLIPKLTESGEVLLSDNTGEVLMTIPAVYVKDSSEDEKYTYDNMVSLTQISMNTYVYEITVDENFLTNDETVYPVYIDPYVSLYSNSIEDTFVCEENPNENYSGLNGNLLGYSNDYAYNIYMKFNNLPSGISHHNILSAYFETYEYSDTTSSVLAEVVPTASDWDESTITWNNKPGYHNDIISKVQLGNNSGASADCYYDYGSYGKYRIYISNLVRGWIQGLPNYGIVVKCSINTGWVRLASGDNEGYTPALFIIYLDEDEYPVENNLSVPDESNQFYIMNKRSGKYLTATNTTASVDLLQYTFRGTANQKWELESVGSGYYIIKLAGTDYVLDVYSGSDAPSGNTNGTQIQTYLKNGGVNQQWKFERNWNGTYKILSRMSGNIKGLTIENASLDNRGNCILYSHNVNFTYNDDWSLQPVNLNTANFYGFSNTDDSNKGVNTQLDCNTAVSISSQMNFLNTNARIDVSAWVALNEMKSSNLWYFRGHGVLPGSGFIFRSNNSGTYTNSYLYGSHNQSSTRALVSQLDDNVLNNMYLMGSNCCVAGNSIDVNTDKTDLVGMVYRKGAHFVFATPTTSYTAPNRDWMECFLQSVSDGKTYYQAIQDADNIVISNAQNGKYSMYMAFRTCTRHYAGDSSIILCH